jgi:hypothetical protein
MLQIQMNDAVDTFQHWPAAARNLLSIIVSSFSLVERKRRNNLDRDSTLPKAMRLYSSTTAHLL